MEKQYIETDYGAESYYKDPAKTILHRTDGPAIIASTGQSWWINGKLHRLDGPAKEHKSGTKQWYVNGKRHRVDGPAVEYANGIKEWYVGDVFIFSVDKGGKVLERMK